MLSEESAEKLRGLPETGMGFQLVSASLHGTPAVFVVFNAEFAFDLSQVQLLEGRDPTVILSNSLRVLDAVRLAGPPIVRIHLDHERHAVRSASWPGLVA